MLTDRSHIARSSRSARALCSSLAIATALIIGAGTARAQTAPSGSFQGNGTFTVGSGTITTGTGTTTINLVSNNAVIDWTTFDTANGGGPINFQPSATTATFQRASDFSVLNRILPTDPSRAVQFNGNVISLIQGSTATTGGTVYFYSPGGVILGPTAVFNIGNLGLTSAEPVVNANGQFVVNNRVQFQLADPGSSVQLQSSGSQRARVNAPVSASYVAVIAPRVVNSGAIVINGSTALVSADAATITFNPNGLFDIQVSSGTSSTGVGSDGVTLVNTGSITGPAGSPTSQHRIYFAAVPKNIAITMAIAANSNLGFTVATAADLSGSAVILSGSRNVIAGEPVTTRSAVAGTGVTNITFSNSSFNSYLRGRTDGSIISSATSLVNTRFMELTSDQSISFGTLNSGGVILNAGGALSTGNVFVNLSIFNLGISLSAGGDISTGNLASTFQINDGSSGPGNIFLLSRTGSIATGNISTRTNFIALAGGGVTLGSVSTGTGPQNYTFIAGAANATLAGPVGPAFNPTRLFTLGIPPTPAGGQITVNGPVSTGNLTAATAQNFTAQSILAGASQLGNLIVDAGGLVSVNGAWLSNNLEIVASDIAIGEAGSLDSGALGELSLASRNTSGAFIGDGLTGSGFNLSNAEFGKLKAGDIKIVSFDIPELATDMTIGNLTITGGQLYGSGGTVLFATGNPVTEMPGGILRVAGAVTATGFAATNEIDLASGTVELEAEKGSLKIDDGSGGLGGLIYVVSKRFHLASDAILTKLRADPSYASHITELNAPAAIQRPDGVFNARLFDFEVSDAILIQNTGTRLKPAGFVATFGENETGGDTTPPTAGRELVLNGQLQTSTGTLSGKTAFDQVIAKAKAEAIADRVTFGAELNPLSTFNGCVILSGVCSFSQADPVAALSSEITVVTNATLDESPVAPTADDSDEGDDGSSDQDDEDSDSDDDSPIAPVISLISTGALDGEVNVVEPVSGAGNPSLFSSVVTETTAQGEKP